MERANVAVADWIQAGTLFLIAAALLLNVRQNRELARQTLELVRQNATIASSLRQNAHLAISNPPSTIRASLLLNNPELLQWHLGLRGLPAGTPQENLRRLFIMAKVEVHELNFLSHRDGMLSEDIWSGWRNVMASDFVDSEFQESWTAVKHSYAPTFVAYVDEHLADWDEPGAAAA
jgi:hypothetical protein